MTGGDPNGDSGRNLRYSAKVIGVSPHTLRAFVRQRKIAHYRVGRRLVFKDEDLREFLARHRVEVRPA